MALPVFLGSWWRCRVDSGAQRFRRDACVLIARMAVLTCASVRASTQFDSTCRGRPPWLWFPLGDPPWFRAAIGL